MYNLKIGGKLVDMRTFCSHLLVKIASDGNFN